MNFQEKKRIVIKIGSNSLMHRETGKLDYGKIGQLVREIADLKNMGKDVCLVSSGAIAVGRQRMGFDHKPDTIAEKQALASVGQARLMSLYQQIFSEYNQQSGQVLMTKNTLLDDVSRENAQNTFEALFKMGVVPVVNENDTVSTSEIRVGDNDRLSAIVAAIIDADLLILLSDIDGLYDRNPRKYPDAKLIPVVDRIDSEIEAMASSETGSDIGTGGMGTKISAARIATYSGCDMVIANSADVTVINRIIEGDYTGTLFTAHKNDSFDVIKYLED